MRRLTRASNHQLMNHYLAVGYGAVGYLMFLAAFGYAIGFVGNIALPHSIDHGIAAPVGQAVVVNALLLGLFAAQQRHGAPSLQTLVDRLVPDYIERST